MDLTTIQLLMGILGASVGGSIGFRRRTTSKPEPTDLPAPQAVLSGLASVLDEIASVLGNPSASIQETGSIVNWRTWESDGVVPLPTSEKPSPVELKVSSCPACGLTAPGHVMAEHLMLSPSHKKSISSQKMDSRKVKNNGPPNEEDHPPRITSTLKGEDIRKELRSLLQIMVPPRAFGHRHSQRTFDPLLGIADRWVHAV